MQVACPLPAALTDIPVSACPFRFDQIVRVLYQRRQTATSFATEALMKVLANWTALTAATDDTKVVVSPIFSGFVIPSSEPITVGGNDNSTFNGIREYYGEGAVTATGNFKNISSDVKAAMQLLTQESLASSVGVSNLTAYFVNKDGVIFYTDDQRGIPVYNARIGSVGSEGLNAPNVTPFGFDLQPEWDTAIKAVIPSFDPLTEL